MFFSTNILRICTIKMQCQCFWFAFQFDSIRVPCNNITSSPQNDTFEGTRIWQGHHQLSSIRLEIIGNNLHTQNEIHTNEASISARNDDFRK